MDKTRLFHTLFKDNSPNIADLQIVKKIAEMTFKGNLDNITRTKEYQTFYLIHPEIKWAFLASMVSRNAGWNMCDLHGKWMPELLADEQLERLFLSYERANWLIFRDAYPQLLIYHYSTIIKRPLFHLLEKFNVSQFMVKEWEQFYKTKDQEKLLISLIINEQNLIQLPVIEQSLYKKRVFGTNIFKLQEMSHFSCVLFPTLNGRLYGASVVKFRELKERIHLGRRLANILFNPDLYYYFLDFALHTEHTGSRYDYEQYFLGKTEAKETPVLRMIYPAVEHHLHAYEDWSQSRKIEEGWFQAVTLMHPVHVTEWFLNQQSKMKRLVYLKKAILK